MSIFDPHGIYRQAPNISYRGQVIQKRATYDSNTSPFKNENERQKIIEYLVSMGYTVYPPGVYSWDNQTYISSGTINWQYNVSLTVNEPLTILTLIPTISYEFYQIIHSLNTNPDNVNYYKLILCINDIDIENQTNLFQTTDGYSYRLAIGFENYNDQVYNITAGSSTNARRLLFKYTTCDNLSSYINKYVSQTYYIPSLIIKQNQYPELIKFEYDDPETLRSIMPNPTGQFDPDFLALQLSSDGDYTINNKIFLKVHMNFTVQFMLNTKVPINN